MSTSTYNIGTNGPAVRSHDPSDGRCAAGKRETDEAAAALPIQRHYRGYATRKQLKGMHMGSEARWNELMKHTEERTVAEEQLDNKNDVKSRWRRGVKAAARLQAGDAIHPTSTLAHPTSSSSSSDADVRGNAEAGPSRSNRPILDKKTKKARRARFWGKLTVPAGRERDENEELPFQSKALEQQHWLEMIDGKHRYGSNLKYYFREWKEADTKDNFFRWLDRGEGKNLDLEELPRDRLEKERITYLSAEQRLNYLVRIDEEGLIRWVHNDELVDTAAGKWQDSGDGTGIVPDESYTGPSAPDKRLYASPHADKAVRPPRSHSGGDESDTSSVSSDSYGAGSELQENEATHYDEFAERDGQKGWMERKFKEITPGGMKKELLRKTLRGNTWIYASDMKMNLFVGIKQSGTFQHSSFIAGGKVTSAGIIVVKRGVIKKLNPWSGHYRSTIAHYRAFIAQLEDKGADLSHVKVGKSVMQMWGLGKYTAITKGQKGLIDDVKRKLHLKHEPNEMEKSEALKKKVEEGERKAREKKEEGQEGQNGSPEVR